MKKILLFTAGIAVGLCAARGAAPASPSAAVLNTSTVYIEVLTLVPGEGTGQHSIIPAEVGVIAEGEVILSSPNGREALEAGKAFALPGLTPHDIRNESNRPAKVYVIAMKRCD
jgi:mannose-6-phosphate isomerase-like protein (cupin superfamily)